MITSLLLLIFALHSETTLSEGNVLAFKPPELSRISRDLAGSETNWPIVFQTAEYLSGENTFVLDAASMAELERFLQGWRQIDESRKRYTDLIRSGAGVFAAREVARADSIYQAFRGTVDKGDIDSSLNLISDYNRSIEDMARALEENRVVDVEARLSEKQGTVEFRRGLIGQWLSAAIGNLFREADGVRTASESTGIVTFVDGSEVTLAKNTTAIIRSSRLDRLTNTSDVEINISQGGLLARLSADGIERSNYQISAGSATMLVKSSNFWTEKTDEDRVVMANYSGTTTITAENEVINLGRNQGTIVVRGRVPLQPIQLLPPPRLRWSAADSVIIRDQISLSWNEIEGASRYEVDISDSPSFDGWVRSIQSESNQGTLTDIPVGISHLRVRAYDENDLRGAESQTYRILRSTGTLPPYLFLEDGDRTEIYTSNPEYTLSGVAEPGSTFRVNGNPVSISQSGDFSITLSLDPGRNPVEMIVTNASGIVTRQQRVITKISEDKLFDLNWSTFAEGGRVRFAEDILITGRAYPPLEVVARIGDLEKIVPCGINGNWALSVNPEQDSDLTIALRYRDSKEIIGERTYRIE
jgi:hypothetical protein